MKCSMQESFPDMQNIIISWEELEVLQAAVNHSAGNPDFLHMKLKREHGGEQYQVLLPVELHTIVKGRK